jgi:hypothetical protein
MADRIAKAIAILAIVIAAIIAGSAPPPKEARCFEYTGAC